jgi:hypothetical protein
MMRLHCLVPGCRRTRGQRKGEEPITGDEEWICSVHWKMVPRSLKSLRTKSRRRWDREVAIAEHAYAEAGRILQSHMDGDGRFRSVDHERLITTSNTLRHARWARWRAWRGIWRRMKRAAIEGGAGI